MNVRKILRDRFWGVAAYLIKRLGSAVEFWCVVLMLIVVLKALEKGDVGLVQWLSMIAGLIWLALFGCDGVIYTIYTVLRARNARKERVDV